MSYDPNVDRWLRIIVMFSYIIACLLIIFIILDVFVSGGLFSRFLWFGIFVGITVLHLTWLIIYLIFSNELSKTTQDDYRAYIYSSIFQIVLFTITITPITFVNTISDDRFRDYLFLFVFLNISTLILYPILTNVLIKYRVDASGKPIYRMT